MLSLNHTSTPTIRARLLRDLPATEKKILYITDMSEDIFIMQKYASVLSKKDWTEISSLSAFWDMLERPEGYFFLSTNLLRVSGNLTHLRRSSGLLVERNTSISETTFIEQLIQIEYTHGDATDTPATYRKQGGTLTLRDAVLPITLQFEWFDTELDSIIVHRDGKRDHVASIRISAGQEKVGQEKEGELTETMNLDLIDALRTVSAATPSMSIITAGLDFLTDASELTALATIHMGAFTDSLGISVDGSVPEITSILEFAEILRDESRQIEIYTRAPRIVRDFMEENSIQRHDLTLEEVSSARLSSALWTSPPIGSILEKEGAHISPFLSGDIQNGTKHLIITDALLSGLFVRQRSKKSIAKHLDLLLTLKPGDYVVHREHGIALFHAVVKKTVGATGSTLSPGITREYLELHYAGDDKLFVPLTEIYRVSRYLGDNHPELTKLSGKEWERTMEKTDAEIQMIAEDILETSARRSLARGRAFGVFREQEETFREAFPYEYTSDQLRAIEEVFSDMEKDLPMDRLISGDVGFGKTEVAMNAIYKAVLSGSQVAVLSPLLVLADEHYETFVERLGPYGIRVAVLTRMSTPAEVKKTLEDIRQGSVDVVVGTHRLISDDVIWKRLGLLIIDEEHKFGVSHKEKIKKLRAGLDILALSATPIPRSLNLALSGLKQISLLTTPPRQKKPIDTIVARWNDQLVGDAIEREMSRGGQVIIVHNRIRGMESIEKELEMILEQRKKKGENEGTPEKKGKKTSKISTSHEEAHDPSDYVGEGEYAGLPRIVITHGQMPAEQIEDRIHAFKKHEYDILLTTTIIENGVNFLSANTIIIIDPEDFGLASLHQLRGRVGRKDVQGYAYLLYRKAELSREEKERLITIANNTHLGAGFEIAMRDMEIRGAGDVLGVKQAGKSKDVGLTLYFRLLEEKIEELKDQKKKRTWTKVELELSIALSDLIFQSEADKLNFYRELENIETIEELESMEQDLLERADSQESATGEGSTSESITHLFLLMRARLLLSDYGVIRLSKIGMNYVFDFREDMDVEGVRRFLERFDRRSQYVLLSVKKVRVETRNWRDTAHFLESLVGA